MTQLYPETETRFFARMPDAQLVFTLTAGGMSSARLRQAGQKITFKKIARPLRRPDR